MLNAECGIEDARRRGLLLNCVRSADTSVRFDTIPAGQRLQTYYPPNRGFFSEPVKQTLQPGTIVDRYGLDRGSFVAPAGTPFEARALAPASAGAPYNVFRVVKPIEVDAGVAAPWFDQPGLGTQYELPARVSDLLKSGHIERVTP